MLRNTDGSYSHINNRNKKRTFTAFYGWSGFLDGKELYPEYLRFWKVNGFYIFEIESETEKEKM